jgi:LmbE family N-acetylglucosaminyl deacetylase
MPIAFGGSMETYPEPVPGCPVLVLSPHLDDAVFACGRLLASVPAATVATIFAGRPASSAPLTEWDRASGFRPGDDVIGARRDEDRLALGILGANPVWLEFRDRQYGPGVRPDEIARELDGVLARCAPGAVFFPLGLFHSDHHLTHEAALLLLGDYPQLHWFAYEDRLYRRQPGLCHAKIARLRRVGLLPRPARFRETTSAAARKCRAVRCYRSQLRALATPGRPGHQDVFGGERYWRLATRMVACA